MSRTGRTAQSPGACLAGVVLAAADGNRLERAVCGDAPPAVVLDASFWVRTSAPAAGTVNGRANERSAA
jgi:hypothetical protein